MGTANYVQTNFLGGEWSPYYQGRIDHPRYKTAMNVCFNGLPLEEGAWARRPGTRLCIPTYAGREGRVQPLSMRTDAAYSVEFTNGFLRFYNGALPVFTEDTAMAGTLSTTTPARLSLSSVVEWGSGDEIVLVVDNSSAGSGTWAQLRNRVLKIIPVPIGSLDAWSSGTSYTLNNLVSYSGNSYQSISGSNLNHQPDISPTFWELLVGTPTNAVDLYDSITSEAIDGSEITTAGGFVFVLRLLRLASPYTEESWKKVRIVQEMDKAFILSPTLKPTVLKIKPNSDDALFASASIDTMEFIDGPYLDPIPNSTMTVSDVSGIVTITAAFAAFDIAKAYSLGDYVSSAGQSYRAIAEGAGGELPATAPFEWVRVPLGTAVTGEDVDNIGFQDDDALRLVRLFSQPPPWNVLTAYNAADPVYYNNVAYVSVIANTGVQPDTDTAKWAVNPTGARWVWGRITTVNGPNSADLLISDRALLFPGTVYTWRLGLYSYAVGFPSCGAMYEGRLWLGGRVRNRFDASATDRFQDFFPTLPDGTVSDNCAISYTLEASDANQIYWMAPDSHGIVVGTLGGEWVIQASQQSDPLTPTSIQAKRVTKYGCANVEPRRTGIALVFVQKYLRRCLEFISDVFTGKYIAPNLNEMAKHVTTSGVAEIAYQEELVPVLWSRLQNGNFTGSTYRRTSTMTTESPAFMGWHRHELGTRRTCESLISGPSADAKKDTLMMVTNDPLFNSSGGLNQTVRWVESMSDIFEPDDVLFDAWFLDGAMVPSSMYEATVGPTTGIYFTGLWYMNTQTVTVFAGGLDVGDYLVTDGKVFVPYGTGEKPAQIDYNNPGAGAWKFTAAYIASVTALNFVPKNGGIFTSSGGGITILGNAETIPAVTTIQSYVPTNAFSGESLPVDQSDLGVFPNWGSDLVSFQSDNPSRGLRTFTLSDGDQIAFSTWATIGYDAPLLEVGTCVSSNSLAFVAGSSSYNPLIEVNQTTLALQAAYNRESSVGDNTRATGAVSAIGLAGVKSSAANFIIDAGFVGRKIDLVDPDQALLPPDSDVFGAIPFPLIREGLVEEGNANFCTIVASNTKVGIHILSTDSGAVTVAGYYGTLHTLVNPVNGSFLGHEAKLNSKKGKGKKKFSIDQVDLFEPSQVGVNKFDIKKIGDILPSDVRPEWTRFTQVGGVCTDQTDSCTIAYFVNEHDLLAASYNNSTTYAAGDKVLAADAQVYESRNAGNVGHQPTKNQNPSFWNYSPLQSSYIVKLAAETTEILWKVPINSLKSAANVTSAAKCSAGIFLHIGSVNDNVANTTYPVYLIDTVSGTYKVVSIKGIVSPNHYTCNGNAYQLLVNLVSYDSTVPGAPVPQNATVSFNVGGGAATANCLLTIGADSEDSPIPSLSPISLSTFPGGFPQPRPILEETGAGTGQFPCVVGTCYTSKGQILRPATVEDTKGQTGPGSGKTRRTHYGTFLWTNVVAVKIGTVFSKVKNVLFRSAQGSGNQLDPLTPFSGTTRETLEDDYTYDSMICWQVTRPYPLNIAQVGGFVKVQDV